MQLHGCCQGRVANWRMQRLLVCSGVTIKTRKRNIVVPVDPNSFANAVVAVVQDASEGLTNTEEIVEAATKAIDNANLEFNRYGDTLFEVLFAGGILAAGGKLADESAPKFATNVGLSCSCRAAPGSWQCSTAQHAACSQENPSCQGTRELVVRLLATHAAACLPLTFRSWRQLRSGRR